MVVRLLLVSLASMLAEGVLSSLLKFDLDRIQSKLHAVLRSEKI
jgi:hypothetical protein